MKAANNQNIITDESLSRIVSHSHHSKAMLSSSQPLRPLLPARNSTAATTTSKNIFPDPNIAVRPTDSRLAKFHHLTSKNNFFNPNMFVQPTDSSLCSFHDAITPIVLEKYKLVLFTNPKMGSTVLRQLMRRMMGYTNYYVNTWGKDALPHTWPANGLNYTSHYSLDKINEMMTSDKWTRATFVRDPKERALSAYLMLRPQIELEPEIIEQAKRGMLKNESIWKMFPVTPQIVKCCRMREERADANWNLLCLNHVLTFEGFLDAIDNGKSKFGDENTTSSDSQLHTGAGFTPEFLRKSCGCADIHWSPLSHWRLNPKLCRSLNFVGHLENAEQDIRRLLNILGPDAWEKYGASGW
eukprot:CAMPEP_0172322420 /NCGR_PEP_ID=MMETSP1058-20130122/45843_1 /TAXON_ID=83371 /ORGANISM="Detonula confervacea, Strain CCMP 353" /LENGTH=354 /DNA_ID=CAMNT_0013038157 /DNA_START=144 /DNA_END=1205 /DNA_ORIENTATION=-